MAETEFVELLLTCASWQEAQAIADDLLARHLIACAEFIEVKSKYHWLGTQETAHEVKLIMESVSDNFNTVEAAIAKLHSYKTFVLLQVPLSNVSANARLWLKRETTKKG